MGSGRREEWIVHREGDWVDAKEMSSLICSRCNESILVFREEGLGETTTLSNESHSSSQQSRLSPKQNQPFPS